MNNEIITLTQLENHGIYLSKMEKERILEKIDRGIYVTKDLKYDEYYLFQLKYSKAIFSYNTALYFYEMTVRTPIKMDVIVYREYNPHSFKDLVNVYKDNKELYNLGIIERIGKIVKCYRKHLQYVQN